MILEKLRESTNREQIENKGLEDLAKNVNNSDDAVELIKKIDKMIKSKKNNILMLAYQQGEIFRRFKTNNKFTNTVSELKFIYIYIYIYIYIICQSQHFIKHDILKRVVNQISWSLRHN